MHWRRFRHRGVADATSCGLHRHGSFSPRSSGYGFSGHHRPGARRPLAWIGLARLVHIVCRWSDPQGLAVRLDSGRLAMIVDEGDHHLCLWSSSAFAKPVYSRFRISFARLNSRFSFSISLRRSRSAVVSPVSPPPVRLRLPGLGPEGFRRAADLPSDRLDGHPLGATLPFLLL